MITFFPPFYEDELLYSAIARYHYYLGNKDFRDTLTEIFGSSSKIPSFDFPSSLEYFSGQLPKMPCFTIESLINNHTLFPLYEPFLPEKRASLIRTSMKYEKGWSIHAQIGAMAGGVCVKDSLSFCPKCVEEDLEKLGESYFRRAHNVQGVHVCYKHGIPLHDYPISFHGQSRIAFIRLDHKLLHNTQRVSIDPQHLPLMRQLAESAYNLLNKRTQANQQSVHQSYINLIGKHDLLTSGGHVRQRDLYEEFISYYGRQFLACIESDIRCDDESNWLKILTRKPRRVTHPIRHLLLINFLSSSLDDFFLKRDQRTYFGQGPWYCLNPVADHYHERVVSDCKVTADYKTRQPVATFSCSCGFIYSRKGPDTCPEDGYKLGRVKQFGGLWETELKELLVQGNLSLRASSRTMGCDPKTIVKYAEKLGLRDLVPGNMVATLKNNDKTSVQKHQVDCWGRYCNDILTFLKNHPDNSRKQIREALKKQYIWFYRNDREWLENNLPSSIPRNSRNHKPNGRVDWIQRDEEILKKVNKTHREILAYSKPTRITQSLIGTKLGIKPLLDKHLDLLPKTKGYLKEVTETVEQFQLRRIEWICTQVQEQRDLKKWELVRLAGLRANYSEAVEAKIDQLIET